ncbi:MAG: SinI family restriction endonuclease [Bacteroidia bacterium]
MKENIKFDNLSVKAAIAIAKMAAQEAYTSEMETVITVAFSDKRNLPALGFKQDIPIKDYVETWVRKYLTAYNNRPSIRKKKPSGTFPDPIMKAILQVRLPKADGTFINQLEAGHQAMMNIENLVGELLEEYLSDKLSKDGWCCCWGSTIDAVDFCKVDGTLLQVKNSSNSENSSSVKVRLGTSILKWYRRMATKRESFMWEKLHELVGRKDLTEQDFRKYVAGIVKNNPACIFIAESSILNN